MATIQVRDVPREVADAIAARAAAAGQSVSAYLRDLMAADAAKELRVRAMQEWHADLEQHRKRHGLTRSHIGDGAGYVRQVRDERERELVDRITEQGTSR